METYVWVYLMERTYCRFITSPVFLKCHMHKVLHFLLWTSIYLCEDKYREFQKFIEVKYYFHQQQAVRAWVHVVLKIGYPPTVPNEEGVLNSVQNRNRDVQREIH